MRNDHIDKMYDWDHDGRIDDWEASNYYDDEEQFEKDMYGETENDEELDDWESYDEGYEAVCEDEDYDSERYDSDPDYADGVDDAMDECDW